MGPLELLAGNEEEISDLYKLYAGIMPQYKDLWLELSNEETDHAVWIRDFIRGIKKGTLFINEKRFPAEAFQTYREYLQESMKEAVSGAVDDIRAFTVALYIEQSLIDLNFWEVLDAGSEDFNKVALRLQNATKGHIEKIKKYWLKVKGREL
jgi:rubrerythrin